MSSRPPALASLCAADDLLKNHWRGAKFFFLSLTVGVAAHLHTGGLFSPHKCWRECNSLEVAPDRESDEAVTARREFSPLKSSDFQAISALFTSPDLLISRVQPLHVVNC
ncbi:hypothetical protein PVAP13_3NG269101 [Panicum virgatum]|uniref:Uncharacterized protein n=1 Tax=Panicum virgatum TaxID=38727 RepID=A0A8T0UEA5_PANVG|nr:hypothetical protein PVAP13_3NG269101 [Panicum virgatum]